MYKVNIISNKLKNLKLIKSNNIIRYKLINNDEYLYVYSTSKGFLLDKDALKLKVGGIKIFKFN